MGLKGLFDQARLRHLVNRGLLFMGLGAYEKALRTFRRALSIRPHDATVNGNIGLCLQRLGKLGAAAAAFKRAARLDPDNAIWHRYLGGLRREQERLDEAAEAYDKAVAIDPEDARSQFALGAIYGQLDRLDDAVAAYRRGLEHSSAYAEVSSELAAALLDSERYEDAEGVLDKLREVEPDNPAVYVNTARLRGAQGNWEEARASCEQAIQLNANWADSHHMMGTALAHLGRHDAARSAYEEAVRLDPRHGRAQVGLAHLCRLEGDDQQALAAYRWAHKAAPDCYESAKGLAELCDDLGLVDNSLAAWEDCVRLRPDNAADQKRLGELYYELGRFEDALRRCQAAVNLDPVDAEAHNNLAAALFGLGRYDEAAEACKRAIDLRPAYGTPHMTLAEICMERGDHTGAEKELRILEELDGRMADDLFDALYRWRSEAGVQDSPEPAVTEKPSLLRKVSSLLEVARGQRAKARPRRPTIKRETPPRPEPAAVRPDDHTAGAMAEPVEAPKPPPRAVTKPEAESLAVPSTGYARIRRPGSRRKGVGHLIVFSDPPAQGVFLDGVWKGVATLSLRNLKEGEHNLKVGEASAPLTIYKDFQSRVRLKDGMLSMLSEPTVVSIAADSTEEAANGQGLYRCRVYLDNKTDFSGEFHVWLMEGGAVCPDEEAGPNDAQRHPPGSKVLEQAVAGDTTLLFDGVLKARPGDRLRVVVPRQPGFEGRIEHVCAVDSDLRIRLTLASKGSLRARDVLDIDVDTTW